MKKALSLMILVLPVFSALFLNFSCSTKTPTAADNFQNPVQTIVATNPTYTFTATYTFTITYTFTPSYTPTTTFTPYVTATPWTGFSTPEGIAADSDGNVYVADTGHNYVDKYNSNGILVAGWGAYGVKGKVPYTLPVAVAVYPAGATLVATITPSTPTTLYVVGSGNPVQVSEYGPTGNQITASFSQFFTFSNPKGLAVDGNGYVYVSDTGNNRIVQLSPTGATGSGFGGSGALTLTAPATIGSVTITSGATVTLAGIAVNNGNVYVAVQGSGINGSTYSSVVGFDVATGDTTTVAIPGFKNPTGIAFDSSGNLYVADTGNKQVEEFSPTGGGTYVQVPLQFNGSSLLASPMGVAVDPYFNIYVTDSMDNEVFKFAP